MKHVGKRDIPGKNRPHRERHYTVEELQQGRGKLRLESGDLMPRSESAGREPRRPAFLMLLPDLGDPREAPPGVFGMYPATFIPKILATVAALALFGP